tara:strand:- start:138 stop:2363 length:2226 start_codon:yes stop_codon:yes gene_type:complete
MFTNKEGFSTVMLSDVLLGKKNIAGVEQNRLSLSDDLNDNDDNTNDLNIIYSTYYSEPKLNDNLSDIIQLFLRTNVVGNNKIIGDIVSKVKSDKLSINNINNIIFTNKNIPHVLNPILKQENAIELSVDDIKKIDNVILDETEDIVQMKIDYNTNENYTLILLNLLGIKNNKEAYKNNNMKKIYDFFTKGKTDENILSTNNIDDLDIEYENSTGTKLFKIIKKVKYIEELRKYYEHVENQTLNIEDNVINEIKNIIQRKSKDTNKIYASSNVKYDRVAGTYESATSEFKVPFKLNDGNKEVYINNNNKYMFQTYLQNEKYKYSTNEDNSKVLLLNKLISGSNIMIDTIILFQDTELETKFEIPYINIEDDAISSNNESDNSELEDTIKNRDGFLIDITNKINNFKNKFDYILNKPSFFLKIPLNFIRMKDPTDDDTHIIFGDIIDTGDIINTDNSILSNYVKVPRRCCFKTDQYYGDDNNQPLMSITSITNTKYNIYQHPIYKTFKIFSKNEDLTDKYIYEIEPCATNVSLYEKNIKAYNKLKGKCKNIKTFNDANKIKDNSFNQLEIKTKLNTINKNKQNLTILRNNINKLEQELDRKEIIKSNYNRVKLQKHNEYKQDQIYEGTRRLNKKNSLGVTVAYPQKVLDYLIQMYDSDGKLNMGGDGKEKTNEMLKKLRNLNNETNNKDFNKFIEKQLKEDNIDIVKLLPDPNSKKFKDKWINKKLITKLENAKSNVDIRFQV